MKENVSLLRLFWKFFKIGIFTFGGGYVMIPLIEKEMVENKWIDKKDIADIVAVSQSIPGAVAVNMSLFVGFKIAKKKGAISAVFGCILPSFIIILIIATLLTNIQDEVIVQHAFVGILSAVVALIILSAIKIAKVAILDKVTLFITIITVILLLLGQFLTLSKVLTGILPILLIISGALTGLLIYFFYPKKVRQLFKAGEDK
ncbi:chromate transporter [Mycoplasmatota bacterium]|nr:chromate transporter [Mycoplasmatota bacterium]